MAEEVPVVHNKRLLLVSLLLGAIVVFVYNVHIDRVKKAGKGTMIPLLRYKRDMNPGEKITEKDLYVQEVSKQFEGSLGEAVDASYTDFVAMNCHVGQSVKKEDFVMWPHVTRSEKPVPSATISRDKVAVPLAIDPMLSPGTILRVGDRVNLKGILALKGQPAQAYRIIEGVRVHAIGGQAMKEGKAFGKGMLADEGMARYRTITIEVDRETSLHLTNVLSHLRGDIQLEVRNPESTLPFGSEKINSQLEELTKAASLYAPGLMRPTGQDGS